MIRLVYTIWNSKKKGSLHDNPMRLIRLLWLPILVGVPSWGVPISDKLTIFDPTHSVFQELIVYEDGSYSGGVCAGPACGIAESPANFYYIPANIGNPALANSPFY